MNDDRLLLELRRWLKEEQVDLPDAEEAGQRITSRLPQTRPRRRRWWRPAFLARTSATSDILETTEYQPGPIPATNGHTPTVLGRTTSMLSPAKAITAGALVFALGGAFLVTQPFGQQGAGGPGAENAAPPVAVSGTSVLIDNNGPVVQPPPGMEERRRDQERIYRYEMDDARLSGDATVMSNADKWFAPDGDDVGIFWASVTIENDDGSWNGTIVNTDGQGDAFDGELGGLIELTGSGDYAGWSAILYEYAPPDPDRTDATPTLVNGLVFPGDLPPDR